MDEKRRFIDVWIIETNTVYREVPYEVVADWVQQGRLLEDDRLRQSGTNDWVPLGSMPAFAAYLPKAEPFRAEDQAEALEQVQIDLAWRHPRDEEDQDPDMIPLIDVSLVLLIFFMMTATVATGAAFISTPWTHQADLNSDLNKLWIGIDFGRGNEPVYSLGQGTSMPAAEDQRLTEAEVLQHFQARLVPGTPVDVSVKANHALPYAVVKHLTEALEGFRSRGLIGKVFADVREGE
jgi:biopolymer transport protein ExbD